MAIAKITYNLEESEELLEFKQAISGPKLAKALNEITHNLKKELKTEIANTTINKYDAFNLVFNKIDEIIIKHNIKLNEITL